MSKTMQPVSLNILGKEYKIACAADEREGLIRTAQELDRQMRKIRDTGKVAGTERIAVLAALNLAHDGGPAKSNVPDAELGQRLNALRLKIENVLENP
ncbi:MAG: cell division protein ZapA [Methylomonas sp.]|nr:cell division protein ZapA [Methylomonas sp.]